jgi:hypothetical protein
MQGAILPPRARSQGEARLERKACRQPSLSCMFAQDLIRRAAERHETLREPRWSRPKTTHGPHQGGGGSVTQERNDEAALRC